MIKQYKQGFYSLIWLSFSLSAQPQQIDQIRQQMGELTQQMQQLNQQTIKITQQNALNANSNQGAYLLPGSKTPAALKSLMGTLKLSLGDIQQVNNATLATLRISSSSDAPLPAFSGTIESGQIQGILQNYQEIDVRTQTFTVPAILLTPSDVTIKLRFDGISPAQLGFVRVHDLKPTDPGYQPPPANPFQH